MSTGIYKLVNLSNQRVYIGSAKDMKTRWRNHLYRLRHNKHHNQFLQADYNKCGEALFTFAILEECGELALVEREQFWIDACYDHQDKCYNLRQKAESNRGFRFSEETKRKMSAASKGRKPSAATIAASVAARRGTKLPTETCQKMKEFQSNRSEEHRRKLGEAQKTTWQDPEYRAKMSRAHQGPRLTCRKKITQLTLEGVEIGTYLGAEEASKATGVCLSTIRQAALGSKKTAGGFKWKYEK